MCRELHGGRTRPSTISGGRPGGRRRAAPHNSLPRKVSSEGARSPSQLSPGRGAAPPLCRALQGAGGGVFSKAFGFWFAFFFLKAAGTGPQGGPGLGAPREVSCSGDNSAGLLGKARPPLLPSPSCRATSGARGALSRAGHPCLGPPLPRSPSCCQGPAVGPAGRLSQLQSHRHPQPPQLPTGQSPLARSQLR